MSKKIYGVVGLLIALALLVIGYAAGRGYKTYEVNLQASKMEMDHSTMPSMEHGHISVAQNRVNPKVKLTATADTMGGYNLNIATQYFYFTPQNAGKYPVQNTGHAHVFVNDVKIGRAYGQYYYVAPEFLKSGTNTITVILNANNHSDWIAKDGTEISSSVQVSQ